MRKQGNDLNSRMVMHPERRQIFDQDEEYQQNWEQQKKEQARVFYQKRKENQRK